jgi:hypothetical protein
MVPRWLPHGRARVWALIVAVPLSVALACLLGVGLYLGEREGREAYYYTLPSAAPDKLVINASVQKVDVAANDIDLRILVDPQGSLSDGKDTLYPAQDLVVESNSLSKGTLQFPANQRIASQDLTVSLEKGQVTDYPFDSYQASVAFAATAGGKQVPVDLTIAESDTFFRSTSAASVESHDFTGLRLSLHRNAATQFMAGFLLISMWALALAVLGGALLIAGKRRGLPWPALGWMAATLFALSAVRNTAPGSPPFGCLLDYTAFLWSEAIIAFSVIYVVVRGLRVEWAAEN